jgi:hypothetical protein
MLRYVGLPRSTPPRIKAGVVLCALLIGASIFVEAMITIYGLIGVFGQFFFETAQLPINRADGTMFALIAISAGTATIMLSYLAYYMNRLSKKARSVSRWVFVPLLTTLLLVTVDRTRLSLNYHISWVWVWCAYEVIVMGGLLPALFLHTRGARKLHHHN